MARDRFSPPYGYDGVGAVSNRAYGGFIFIVVRGPVPRDIGWFRFYRSAGACPPRSWRCEGQALALRLRWGRRGLKPRLRLKNPANPANPGYPASDRIDIKVRWTFSPCCSCDSIDIKVFQTFLGVPAAASCPSCSSWPSCFRRERH